MTSPLFGPYRVRAFLCKSSRFRIRSRCILACFRVLHQTSLRESPLTRLVFRISSNKVIAHNSQLTEGSTAKSAKAIKTARQVISSSRWSYRFFVKNNCLVWKTFSWIRRLLVGESIAASPLESPVSLVSSSL